MTPHNNPAKDFLLYPSDLPHLRRLPKFSRALLESATNDGLSYAAIAAQFDLPMGTVKSRINRARARILNMRATAAQASLSPGDKSVLFATGHLPEDF